jgi:two-component system response regulator
MTTFTVEQSPKRYEVNRAPRALDPDREYPCLAPRQKASLATSVEPVAGIASRPHILLVDDSPEDALLFEEALAAAALDVRLTKFSDGQVALYYLAGIVSKGDPARHPLPEIVLLDLDMPGLSGLEVLAQMRSQAFLRDAVVLVLTGAHDYESLRRARELQIDAFLLKPQGFDELVKLVLDIDRYWLSHA